jgi:hypothetical protein
LFRLENRVCLSHGVHVASAAWHAAMRIVVGVGDLVQRIGDGRTGDREVGWHRVRSAPCTWRREHGFLGWALKPRSTVCEWFGLKTTRTVFTGLTSKSVATVSSGLASKPAATVFSSLPSKLVATVSPGLVSKPMVGFLVEPQNQGDGGFPDLGLKTSSSSLVIWASKLSRRFLSLGFKTKWALVCRLCHKTNGGRSAQDTYWDLAACFTWKQVWLGFSRLT